MPTLVSRVSRAVLALLPLLAACYNDGPLATRTADIPVEAKVATRTIYQAVLVWDSLVGSAPAGIQGDGRNRFGQWASPANQYQGQYCGVWTRLYSYGTGGLDFDPDTYYDSTTMSGSCGPVRQMSLYLNGTGGAPTVLGPHFSTDSLWNLGSGATRLQPATFGQQNGTCVITFDSQYTGASMVRATRLADSSGVRRLRVETQGNQTAACIATNSKGKPVDTGIRYVLPFGVTITQVPAPAPTFP